MATREEKIARQQEQYRKELFPVGKERWIKVQYLNPDKCIEAFYEAFHNRSTPEQADQRGYVVRAITNLDGDANLAQLEQVLDLKREVLAILEKSGTDIAVVNNIVAVVNRKEELIRANIQIKGE